MVDGMEDVQGAAERLWQSLWRQILPFEARMMVFDGIPLSMIKELHPLANADAGLAGLHEAVQEGLLNLLGARLYGRGVPVKQEFWDIFLDACILFEVPHNIRDLARTMGPRIQSLYQTPVALMSANHVVDVLVEYDPACKTGVKTLAHELAQVLHALAWWLLCDDPEVRVNRSGLLAARYASAFVHMFEAGR